MPDETAAAQVAPVEDSTTARLTAAFAEAETSQVDNSDTADDTAATDKVEEVGEIIETPSDSPVEEEKEAESEKNVTDDKKSDDDKTDETDDADEEEADFKTVSEDTEYLNAEQLKEKYPRNASKALIEETARYSAEAKEGFELKAKLGGEPFIEPAVKITESLRSGEAFGVLDGIERAVGKDGLLNVIGNALYVAHEHSKELAKDPQNAEFAKALNDLTDIAFKAEFGNIATPERVKELIQLDAIGAIGKLDKWLKDEYVDDDEWNELVAVKTNPALQAIAIENAELKKQLETQHTQVKSVDAVKNGQVENLFGKTVTESIGTVLSSVVWKNSPLRDLAVDKSELKTEKEFLRSQLQEKAINAFNVSDARISLLEGFRQGRQNTAVWQKQYADAVNDAIKATREATTTAQGMLAKIYGKTRNVQLAQKTNNGNLPPPSEKLAPTVSNEPPPSAIKTRAETKKTLEDFFMNQP